MDSIRQKRIYSEASSSDGQRILVDRLWPRGISKEKAKLDRWAKEITPTNALRKEYHAGKLDFEEFADRYRKELRNNPETKEFIVYVNKTLKQEPITLLSAVKTIEKSHVPVLIDYLEKHCKDDSETEGLTS